MLYKGYVTTNGKQPTMPFKNRTSSDLLTLEQAQKFDEYAGVMADDTVLVDLDDGSQAEILFKLVQTEELKCRVYETTRGMHFLFKTDRPMVNKTHCKLAIGLTADIKGGGRASIEVIKFEGHERKIIYDTGDYQLLPKYLTPVETKMDVLGLASGDGRNDTLFRYILPLQKNEFSVDDCRECLTMINKYVFEEPLSETELNVILREGSFGKPTFYTAKGKFQFDKFAEYLKNNESIIRLNGKLHVYKEGIYVAGDEYIERAMIENLPGLRQSQRKEVLAYLNLLVDQDKRSTDADLIAFKNGVLNVITGDFYDFSPEFVVTNKIPHCYNPSAKSELLEHTLMKLACDDKAVYTLLLQSVGYCFYRRNELRKSFFLLGEKRNGKSTFLDMVQTLLGEENTSNLDLCEIGDRFRTAELVDKLANVGDDIADEWISNTAIFKKVVSGDVITVEKKGKDPFKLRSYAKFFFSANALPRLGKGKDSKAVLDRLVIIPFDAKFTKNDPDYDPFIKYKLREEEVMEALIALAIPALRDVLANSEFESCGRVDDSLQDFEKQNNPILAFFEDLDKTEYLNERIKDVYQKYTSFCYNNNIQALSAFEFQRQMKKEFDLEIKVMEMKGEKVRVYRKAN